MVNRHNYRLTQRFLTYLRDIQRVQAVSVERYRFHLRHVLLWLDEAPASAAESRQPGFHAHLEHTRREHGLKPESLAKILHTTRRFFDWCKTRHPAEFKRVSRDWIQSLRPTRGQASTTTERSYFTLDELTRVAELAIPAGDLAAHRDQAAACFLFLSGMRVGAFVTLPISCVNLDTLTVLQHPQRGVRTKNAKTATTYLLNLPELLGVVRAWDALVRSELPPDAPWCAVVSGGWSAQRLMPTASGGGRSVGLNRRLKRLFEQANVPARSAHKLRHGHAVYGLQHAHSLADYKAVSQNLMHGDMKITDGIYADLVDSEVRARVTGLGVSGVAPSNRTLSATTDDISDSELARALAVLAKRLTR